MGLAKLAVVNKVPEPVDLVFRKAVISCKNFITYYKIWKIFSLSIKTEEKIFPLRKGSRFKVQLSKKDWN